MVFVVGVVVVVVVVVARKVWATLSRIDVSDYTEVKGKFTYLSWSWAWQTLMEVYPESYYKCGENEYFPDGSMSVTMSVVVKDGHCELEREMYLQVLDFKNKAIQNPNSHDINNTRMRCLAKAISMCGLGACLYVGQDLPIPEESRVVAGEPRVPHDEQLAKNLEAMDTAENLAMLKVLARSATDYFTKWKQDDAVAKVREKFESIAATFEQEQAA